MNSQGENQAQKLAPQKLRWKVSRDLHDWTLYVIEQEGDVLPPRTCLQHQGDSERLQQRRHGVILRITWLTAEGPGRTSMKAGMTETLSARDRRRLEKIENSFMAAAKNNQPQRRRCGAETGRENLTTLLNPTVSQCDFARVWTVGTLKPTNRGAEEI